MVNSSSSIVNLNGKNLISCSDLEWPNGSVTKVQAAFKQYFEDKIKNSYDSNLSAINDGTSINGCYLSGRWPPTNYGGQGAHHIGFGWVDKNQNSNWILNFFIETCLESSGSPIKKNFEINY